MNFELSEDQILLKEMVRNFAEHEIMPAAKALEDKHEFPWDLLQKIAGLGILGVTVPPEYEGNQTDNLSLMIALEEISRAMPSLAVIISVHCSLFCNAINLFGNESQKKRYLPKAAQGEIIGAFSLTEPGAGSDATNLKTTAVLDKDTYILNGTKAWVTTGNDALAYIIFAKSEINPGEKKLSSFILDKDTPGLRISKIEEKMGLHASLTAELVLEDCRVSQENLLGIEGQGARIAFKCLDCSRIGIAAQAVGVAQRSLEEALKYSQHREAFGKRIAEFQAIQVMLADIATLTDASRLLTYKAAYLHDQGKPFTKEAAMAKLYASEAANKIAYIALQIHGGYGYSREFFIEQIYRDARVLSIYEGTSEIQRMIIARQLIKE